MIFDKDHIAQETLLAYLEAALEPAAMDEIGRRLADDPELRVRCDALKAQIRALNEVGDELSELCPSIDIVDAVMRRVREQRKSVDTLEQELFALGAQLRVQTPGVDLAASVMAHVSNRTTTPTTPSPVEDELSSIGETMRKRGPRVDVVEPVMAKVAAARDRAHFLTGPAREKVARRHESPYSWRLLAAAACAVFAFSVFFMQIIQPVSLGNPDMARRVSDARSARDEERREESPALREGEAREYGRVSENARVSLLSSLARPATHEEPDPEGSGEAFARETFTIEDVIAARRNTLNGGSDALALLARWGALDPDQVRELLAQGALSPAELAGLSRFLPEDEGRALLREAIAQHPDDPSLRYALARQLMDDPAHYDEAMQHVAAFKALDPNNSLPYYMDAQLRFAQGDYAGALETLEYAADFSAASAYALSGAQHHSEALMAAGYSYEMAQLLAAFNAGTEEYAAVSQLRADLLSYGAYFESLAEYEAALAVYKGVNQMGVQVSRGATFTNEQLAGLDAQMASIEAINALVQYMDIPGGMMTVQTTYTIFLEGLNFFLDYTDLFEHLVGNSQAEAVLRMVQQVMQAGDIAFIQNRGM